MISRGDRIAGGLVGLLVGDALGVPYEFYPPRSIPPRDQIEFMPPRDFLHAHGAIPPGTWSDDGAQALCLLASLLDRGRFDAEDFSGRLVRWLGEGYMAVDGEVFDIGITTMNALQALRIGTPALQAGPADQMSNGNGSLMRVLPLVLWHRGSDEALVRDARDQSRVTHGHVRSQICCALYCLWARRLLDEASDPWTGAVATLRSLIALDDEATEELEWSIRPDYPGEPTGSGYVVDCLRSARHALLESSFEAVVKAAVALGKDTDTTACVAGGMAGIRYGLSGIPSRWQEQLRGRELYEPLLNRLLALD
jgi:ADP-ribosylglycohydrolase